MRIMDIDHLMLSSFRCDFDDTAQYRVSAMNSKGELSAFASVVVKSRFHQKPRHKQALKTNFSDHVIILYDKKITINQCHQCVNVVLKVFLVIPHH